MRTLLDRIFRRQPVQVEQNSGEVLVETTGLRISTTDRVRQLVRHELFQQKLANERETFLEADDFDLDDGETWVSPYEVEFEPAAIDNPVVPPVKDKSDPPIAPIPDNGPSS